MAYNAVDGIYKEALWPWKRRLDAVYVHGVTGIYTKVGTRAERERVRVNLGLNTLHCQKSGRVLSLTLAAVRNGLNIFNLHGTDLDGGLE